MPAQPLNVAKARSYGYSDAQIADEMAKRQGFDIGRARRYGYDDRAIIGELTRRQTAASAPKPPPDDWAAVGGKPVRSADAWAAVGGKPTGSGKQVRLTPVEGNPFAPAPKRGAPVLTPVGGNPFSTGRALPKGRYGSGIEYEAAKLDPALRVTSRGRSRAANARVGGVADSAHLSDNARDFVPQGEPLDAAAARLRKGMPGYKVLVEGPGAAHSTGPHIHVEATGAAPVFAPKLTPVAHDPFAPPTPKPQGKPTPKLTPVRGNPHVAGWLDRIGSGVAAVENSVGKAFEAVPGSARRAAEGVIDSVRHPIRTGAGIFDLGAGALDAAAHAVTGKHLPGPAKEVRHDLPGSGDYQRAFKPYREAYGSAAGLKRKFETDPVGLALDASMVAGGAGAAARLARGASGASRAAEAGELASQAAERAPIVRQITRPEFVDVHSRRAAPVIARARARADLAKQQHLTRLEPLYRAFNGVDLEGQRDFVRRIEGRAPRAPLSPELEDAAGEVRSILADAGADFSKATGTPLRQNYFPHAWADRSGEVVDLHGPAKVGSGSQTKARRLDTLDQGLEIGLREQRSHPLDAVSHYLEDAYNRVGHNNALAALRKQGQARMYGERAIPKGWTALQGPATVEDAVPLTNADGLLTGQRGRRVLAAPDSVAALHNNRLAPSLKDTKVGPLAKAGLGLANATRTSVLGAGSLAHTGLTSIKALGSELSRGANEFLRGDPIGGAKAVAHSFVAPVSLVRRGVEMEKNLLRYGPRGEIERLYVDAGGRVKGSATYETNMAPSWYESARRRTFVQDLGKDAAAIADAQGYLGKGKAGVAAVARALKTVNHFTFKYQVPAVKRGVFDAEMHYFLRHNPGASEAEKLAYARRTLSSIDNRFGEMVADNNFWHTWYQEASRMALLSPSWVQGNVRLFGDALKDAPKALVSVLKGKGMTPDASAMFGVWASRSIVAGMLTYVFAGEMPSGMDWVAPRTGGTNKDGTPERMQVLSSMKDLDQIMYGGSIPDELYGKLNPAVQTTAELLRNKDYFDRPIYRPQGVDPIEGDGGHSRPVDAALYAAARNAPIGVQRGPENPDSNLPAWTRLIGVMPAGQKYSNPEKREANERKYGGAEWRRAVKSRKRERGE